MIMTEGLPLLSVDLVEQLDSLYPERCPSPGMSERDIWMYVGARTLVRSLLARVKEQEEYNLEMNIISNRKEMTD